MELQKYRDALIDRAAAAYSRDALDEGAFEALAARIQTAGGEAELRVLETELAPLSGEADLSASAGPASRAPAGSPRKVALNMSNLKRRGDWVEAGSYRLEGKMSNFDFDFGAYAEEGDFTLRFEVDLSMSNLVLRVPADWRVDCRIERNTASNIKDRGPHPGRNTCRIVVEGELSMSNIVVKRLRPGGGGLWAVLLGR